jgi:hypothetical protein
MMLELCAWLETTWIATLIQESLYGFPLTVAAHIMGLTLSVGTLIWFDLRLLGVVMVECRASELYRRLAPYILTGFVIMFVSGGMLFVAFASNAYPNIFFRIKVAAILLAAANALYFHFTTGRRMAVWDDAMRPPVGARVAGVVSIVVWAVAILAGRGMSYTIFSPPG